jgi:hypothetical protein
MSGRRPRTSCRPPPVLTFFAALGLGFALALGFPSLCLVESVPMTLPQPMRPVGRRSSGAARHGI